MADFTIKRNDTKPFLAGALLSNNVAYDLTGATSVKFIMKLTGAATPKVDAAVIVLDTTGGLIEYRWMAADTDTEGEYNGEFEVVDAGGKILTFPNSGYFTVAVKADLG